jgi:hypothetical protein
MSIVSRELTHGDDCPFRDQVRDLEERLNNMPATFLMLRGVETPCAGCGGYGVKMYASTATWRGGIGGQAITRDVCDRCWGTGDAHRKGTDLRKLESAFRTLEKKVAVLEEKLGNKL